MKYIYRNKKNSWRNGSRDENQCKMVHNETRATMKWFKTRREPIRKSKRPDAIKIRWSDGSQRDKNQ